MATSAQAKKRVRQNEKVRARQQGQATATRSAIRKVIVAAEENAENTNELLNDTLGLIDSAASKGLIHKNKAAREKSRLQKIVNNQ
ncbi:SSU ribosomal protein S20P [Atopostipes suicloacalis DSM 15692]|uniref:Small ribosomal subunit protein bS20 n=1 Tax=Atopostipes suicloacalis DSM 15692 TaxID=1121025 RepID=A0A1M4VWG0_9LACT|nr:30S ribosomal protein S20 [Atopostipes suicloacalis]SHE73308.1 SSU ribosomal protein S20P [Atopostipes suicloacalis DSM 15692]